VSAKVEAGERLSDTDVEALESGRDITALGILAESVRKRLHGTSTTFVRVYDVSLNKGSWPGTVPEGAGEVRLFETPATLDAAVAVVTELRELYDPVPLSAFCLFELGKLPEGLPVVL